jgi:hypothetical protein
MFPTTPSEPEEEDESSEEEDEDPFGFTTTGVGTKPGCTPAGNPAVFNDGVGEGTVAPNVLAGGESMAI